MAFPMLLSKETRKDKPKKVDPGSGLLHIHMQKCMQSNLRGCQYQESRYRKAAELKT